MFYRSIKAGFDYLFAALFSLLLLPFFILITALLWIFNHGKPFFIQSRAGLHGKPFKIIKWRTMVEPEVESSKALSDLERLTPIGKFLRNSSLDELPQLLNILKGEMSFVGPRPLPFDYMSYYNPEEKKRHLVKPGITGLAQVNGRNLLDWKEKFLYDLKYVDTICFWLDCQILLRTLLKIIFPQDINQHPNVSMPVFRGTGNT